ncbi:MAG TPA: OB-fold domain-containing protein, partial [Kineosporiaceae bacterium]
MTFTVNVQPWQPEADPYVIAWVQLHESEGLVLTSNVVEVDADDVRIGMEVEVVFEKHPEHDVWYP